MLLKNDAATLPFAPLARAGGGENFTVAVIGPGPFYKGGYSAGFATTPLADAIAKGLGRETAAAVDAARDMNMYLDDFECCKAACGEAR